MSFIELLLIAIGLSMDAFSVSVCKGLSMSRSNSETDNAVSLKSKSNGFRQRGKTSHSDGFRLKNAYIIALFFGGFQALMPLIGWALGRQFESYITAFDHWVAFALLLIIGSKMIYESLKKDKEEKESGFTLCVKEMLTLSVATSIDALAVGVTFAFLQVSIIPSVIMIGTATFAISLCGVIIGNKFGGVFKNKAELAGGIILVLIGIKILIEHI